MLVTRQFEQLYKRGGVENYLRVLRHWFADPAAATVEPAAYRGFSGARVWRVSYAGEQFALRQWPRTADSPCRLGVKLALQQHLAADGLPVPRPRLIEGRAWTVSSEGVAWGLSTWMPGVADYWRDPRPAKLRAALATLAMLHLSAANMAAPGPLYQARAAVSPALNKRGDQLQQFLAGEFYQVETALGRPTSAEENLGAEALSLILRTAPAQLDASSRWRRTPLPLQWRLTDVWHDHILFTGDQVTGVIDFDAAAVDSAAGDVARLLGSLVGDDAEGWNIGLEAYESVKPLSPIERDAVEFFDSSGVVLSAVNWLKWLFGPPARSSQPFDRDAAVRRLSVLVGRLRNLPGACGLA